VDTGDTQAYSASGMPAGITFNATTRTFSGTPTVSGTYAVAVTATDAGGLSVTATFNLAVTNTAPVATAQAVSTAEDTAKAITLAGTDAEGNALTYTVVAPPTNGTLSGAGASRSYTPSLNFHGGDSFTFKVNDGLLDSAVVTVSLTVTPVNDAPVARPDVAAVNEDSTSNTLNVLANDSDVDGDLLTVTTATALHGTVSINLDGTLSYTPTRDFYGTETITYVVRDPSGATATATLTVTVYAKPVNTLPAGTNMVFQSQSLVFSRTNAPANGLTVADPDSTHLSVVLSVTNGVLQAGGTVGITFGDGVSVGTNTLVLSGSIAALNAALEGLIYKPATNYFGTDFLSVSTSDEGGRQDVDSTGVSLLVEVQALGGVPKVSLESLNKPDTGVMITNVTAIAMNTNLVQGITFDPTNNVVNVIAVGGQDGSTNRSTLTVKVKLSDGTERDVVVPVIIYQPLLAATTNSATYNSSFSTPLFNFQNSLYEQKVRVQNNTPFDFTALRITAMNLPATVTLQNASLTNGGKVYIDYNLPVLSGSNVTLKLEYFSSDLKPFTPGLKLELLNTTRTNAAPPGAVMASVAPKTGYSPDGLKKNYLYWPSKVGKRYYVQYKDAVGDLWKTSGVIVLGTGLDIHWMDDGAPNTDTPPPDAGRFYRVVTDR